MATSVSLEFKGTFDLSSEKAAKTFEEVRRQVISQLGDDLLKTVEANVQSSGVKDNNRFVRNAQTLYRGSLGGYSAVRPVSSQSGTNSMAAITNYLESGHKVRKPSGRSERYTPKVRKYKTTAFGFYADSKAPAQRLLDAAGQKVAEAVAKALEDG